jgi:outer membrane protein insertion porin family
MKMDESRSISGSGNAIKNTAVRLVLATLALAASISMYAVSNLNNYTVSKIFFKFHNRTEISYTSKYRALLRIKPGDTFNYIRIRESMRNLYKVGTFENIEVRVQKKPKLQLEVSFHFSPKYFIRAIKIAGKANPIKQGRAPGAYSKKELRGAIFSMRENTYFDDSKLDDVIREVTQFLNSHGYFNPGVQYTISKKPENISLALKIHVDPRLQTVVNSVSLEVQPAGLRRQLDRFFRAGSYVPHQLRDNMEKARQFLKKQKYYFPDIRLTENFSDESKAIVNLDVKVDCGYRYKFNFLGMKKRDNLIASIWQKKVFEKWAQKESNARILYYLKNKGYLNAEIQSRIAVDEEKRFKTITFSVIKHKKYKLGKIYLEGNRSVNEKELRKVIKTGEQFFDKFIHLRLSSVLVDQEILRLLYYFQGFPSARIITRTTQAPLTAKDQKNTPSSALPDRIKKLDITFVVEEGRRFTVDSILFQGNRFFTSQTLDTYLKTRTNGPFVQQRLNEDLEKIRNLYLFYGFDNVQISPEISAGGEKSILIRIDEGNSYRMGNLIVIGASKEQRRLIARLFPLKKNEPFNQLEIDAFVQDIENSAIFNEFRLTKIEQSAGIMDVLIKVSADYSRYYGFGIGYEGRRSYRGTLEYQGRNVFRSYSSLSAMIQGGPREWRGVLSYDTPYFFKTHINSSLKVWADRETYPSYEFQRIGIGESLIKKLTRDSYLLGSLSWYRTELRELEITPNNIDQPDDPFETTALNLSYVRERRDDPFNPTQGTFFSSDFKFGFPLFEKDYSFVKFQWSFQQNFKLLKSGVLSCSVRNGLASNILSITERFFAGGVNSFRGSWRDRLGPLDPETDKPTGGNALILLNFETTFPIAVFPSSDFYYSVFADIGNVFGTVKTMRLNQMRSSVGIGLKYKTQMGPLRFDLAWDLGEQFTWKNFKFHIGIGNVF